MEKVFSIKELENMIQAIKKDNPNHGKKIPKYACGIFKLDTINTAFRHVGNQEYKRI